jgi:hypothetical protein
MSRPKKMITILMTFVSMLAFSNIALATPPAVYNKNIEVTKSAPPALNDIPIIKIFNVIPSQYLVQGSNLTLNGLVTPGAGGSPIIQVTITANGTTVFNYPSPSFTYNRLVNWLGDMTFVLTAKNAKGTVSTQSKVIKGIALADVINKINITNMEANPSKFMPGQPIDFLVTLQNLNTGLTLNPVNIFITQGTRVVANKTNLNIPPGTYTIQLQDSGFNASMGMYSVDLEFKGVHKQKLFRTMPITLYTIDPT